MSFSKEQRGVLIGMAAGLIITIAGFVLAAFVEPFGSTDRPLTGRINLLTLCGLAPVLILGASIARLAAHRFHTSQDLHGSGLKPDSERAKLLQALLQNTLEQMALALPTYSFWALLGPPHLFSLVPVAAAMFVFGRAFFFWGYSRGASGRAFGFALTFYPTVVLLAGAIVLAARITSP